jgi:selenoprotein W-related protein
VEEEIKEGFSEAEIQLIEGSGGIFEVTCDGTLLFSKLDLIGTDRERFPETGEILSLLQGSS